LGDRTGKEMMNNGSEIEIGENGEEQKHNKYL
jgi:hypothetical protein